MTNVQQVAARYREWTVGDRLRAARESVTSDKTRFAAIIGVSPDTIRHYEQDTYKPKPPVLAAWCLATGFDKDWIVTGQVPNGPETGESVSERVSLRQAGGIRLREVDGIKPRSLLKLVA